MNRERKFLVQFRASPVSYGLVVFDDGTADMVDEGGLVHDSFTYTFNDGVIRFYRGSIMEIKTMPMYIKSGMIDALKKLAERELIDG